MKSKFILSEKKLIADKIALVNEYGPYKEDSIFKEQQEKLLISIDKMIGVDLSKTAATMLFVSYYGQRRRIWLMSDITKQKIKYYSKLKNLKAGSEKWKLTSIIITSLESLEQLKFARQNQDDAILLGLVGFDAMYDSSALDELEKSLLRTLCTSKQILRNRS